jgi:hypothetical protein
VQAVICRAGRLLDGLSHGYECNLHTWANKSELPNSFPPHRCYFSRTRLTVTNLTEFPSTVESTGCCCSRYVSYPTASCIPSYTSHSPSSRCRAPANVASDRIRVSIDCFLGQPESITQEVRVFPPVTFLSAMKKTKCLHSIRPRWSRPWHPMGCFWMSTYTTSII